MDDLLSDLIFNCEIKINKEQKILEIYKTEKKFFFKKEKKLIGYIYYVSLAKNKKIMEVIILNDTKASEYFTNFLHGKTLNLERNKLLC